MTKLERFVKVLKSQGKLDSDFEHHGDPEMVLRNMKNWFETKKDAEAVAEAFFGIYDRDYDRPECEHAPEELDRYGRCRCPYLYGYDVRPYGRGWTIVWMETSQQSDSCWEW